MIYDYKQIWTLTIIFAVIIRSVNVQFAMPVPMPMPFMGPMFPPPPPPPIFPMPAPMPFIIPIQVASGGSDEAGNDKTTTTTTTTSKPEMAVALAMPIPMPVPMPLPALPAMPVMPPMPAMPAMPAVPPPTFCQGPPPRPRNCPPCPPCTCKPSCTPSFFSYCSPCHLKCRCKRVEDAPKPIPPKESIPGPTYALGHIIAPPPVVLVPFPPMHPMPPPRHRPKKKKEKYSSCSDDSTDCSSSDSDYIRIGRRKILNVLRRNPRSSESENELVKPMLSYISENGDIKYEAKISNNDVAELLREGDDHLDDMKYQTVQVLTRDDKPKTKNPKVFSKDGQRGKKGRTKHKRILLRGGITNHVLDDGKKQLIFRPANNKKISNLSVSFQIA